MKKCVGLKRVIVDYDNLCIVGNCIEAPDQFEFGARVHGNSFDLELSLFDSQFLQLIFVLRNLVSKLEGHIQDETLNLGPRHILKNGL